MIATFIGCAAIAGGAIWFLGFMAWRKTGRGEAVRARRMPAYTPAHTPAYMKMLEGVRDSTERQLRQLADGKTRLFRTSVTGDDIEVTQEQIRVLRSQLSELNQVIEWASAR